MALSHFLVFHPEIRNPSVHLIYPQLSFGAGIVAGKRLGEDCALASQCNR